ncbi:MAG: 23S rRNA (adenine(2503)-C(2))-methyltransferase RlmN [Propionibacteriaceae bacterium]|nr:23S rRNA (adenine(2503)-C(2))-methyltransferase RlmN [Propionibacteriaceae bacterium]
MKELPVVFEPPRKGKAPTHWVDLTPLGRREAIARLGLPAFRADQLSRHIFDRFSDDPREWTDLPAAIRAQVAERLFPQLLTPLTRQQTDNGDTTKTLWRLHDGSLVESVRMIYPNRVTMCVSSQAGCGMACPFCATGQAGLQRNMSAGEIVSQVIDGMRQGRVHNIVFMGMGEPLANYNAVLQAIRTMIEPSPNGLGMSARGITVSTVGFVPNIGRLASEGLPVTLALSLHAPDDELRDEIVPINNRWKVAEVLDAAWDYARTTKRRVSIEYALMRDINDQKHRADLLADVLKRRGDWGWVHVNLIPLNPTPGSKWTASRPSDERAFVRRLEERGVPVTLRDTRGREIDGACGQLAATRKPAEHRTPHLNQ